MSTQKPPPDNTDRNRRIRELCDLSADRIRREGAVSVVIIATMDADDGPGLTALHKAGRGNYYAQRGSAIEWIDATRNQGDQEA